MSKLTEERNKKVLRARKTHRLGEDSQPLRERERNVVDVFVKNDCALSK